MALVPQGNGAGWFFSVSLTDTQSDVSVMEFPLQSADYASAQTDANLVLVAIAGVSDAVVTATSLSYREEEDAFSYPANACDNSVKARITYRIAGSSKKGTFEIPAPSNDIFVSPNGADNNRVNTSAPELLAYSGLFLTGGTAFISDGEALDALEKGVRVTRKRKTR